MRCSERTPDHEAGTSGEGSAVVRGPAIERQVETGGCCGSMASDEVSERGLGRGSSGIFVVFVVVCRGDYGRGVGRGGGRGGGCSGGRGGGGRGDGGGSAGRRRRRRRRRRTPAPDTVHRLAAPPECLRALCLRGPALLLVVVTEDALPAASKRPDDRCRPTPTTSPECG
ncbi:hypothetical protein M433DRAFT_330441 [Acidomyces richmondensis BFW]|nr:MAG: hypothetical protein FE78DRAFT_471475 [Acidomyces sp. 'richmondensis']KYG43848.1 hypothetical protein M433DRAFT_330441 [Acidomyces richmondensis BFW]